MLRNKMQNRFKMNMLHDGRGQGGGAGMGQGQGKGEGKGEGKGGKRCGKRHGKCCGGAGHDHEGHDHEGHGKGNGQGPMEKKDGTGPRAQAGNCEGNC